MKHIIISLSIIVGIFLVFLWGGTIISVSLSEISDLMDQCENYIDQNDWDKAEDSAMSALYQWDDMQPVLCFLSKGEELDSINRSFAKATECLINKSELWFKVINAELIMEIEELASQESLGLETIA